MNAEGCLCREPAGNHLASTLLIGKESQLGRFYMIHEHLVLNLLSSYSLKPKQDGEGPGSVEHVDPYQAMTPTSTYLANVGLQALGR